MQILTRSFRQLNAWYKLCPSTTLGAGGINGGCGGCGGGHIPGNSGGGLPGAQGGGGQGGGGLKQYSGGLGGVGGHGYWSLKCPCILFHLPLVYKHKQASQIIDYHHIYIYYSLSKL